MGQAGLRNAVRALGAAALLLITLYPAPAAAQGVSYLSDRSWISMFNGYGPVELDRSNGGNKAGDGTPLKIDGVTYAKGLGAHADSEVRYSLDGTCSTFSAFVGVDDQVGNAGSLIFRVYADNVLKYDSGLMTGAMAGKPVSVNISGAKLLALRISNPGDDTSNDHADWANAAVSCGTSTPTAPPATPSTNKYLSDRTWSSATNGWGPVEKDRSVGENLAGDGKPLTLNGTPYSKGLGVHADSDVRFPLGGLCTAFTAVVGLDDEVGSLGSVVFQVWVDGVQRYDSGWMTGNTASKNVSVNVAGANELSLRVTTGGDNNYYDHADWADAQLACNGTTAPPANQPPTVSLTSPAVGLTLPLLSTVPLAATASDSDGTVQVVEFYVNWVLLGTDTTAPYTFSWLNVGAGTYSLVAVARDNAGAMSVSSARAITIGEAAIPGKAVFAPSANHSTAVDRYVIEFFPAGANPSTANPVATSDVGKPSVVNGECTADVSGTVAGLPAGNYIATITAMGPGGSARSAASPQFTR